MGTLFSALDIGRAGIFAAQVQLDTTGHNIANVNKEGFTRQRVSLTTNRPNMYPFGAIGRGPRIEGIRRLRDVFLDTVYRQQAPGFGSATVKATYFTRIEDLFQEPGENGFSNRLNRFFNSVNDLANNVEGMPVRVALVSEGVALAASLRDAAQFLRRLRTNTNEEVRSLVPAINSLGDRIAKLNLSIRDAELSGQPANDLRDDRDLLIDQLSELVNIRAIERDNGEVDVLLGGDTFVNGGSYRSLETFADATIDPQRSDLLGIRYTDNGLRANISGGKLHGVLQMRDVEIKRVGDQLDTLAAALIREFNHIHASGHGLSFINQTIRTTNPVTNVVAPFAGGVAGLPFPVQDGSFVVNIYNETTQPPTLAQSILVPITVTGPDPSQTTLADIEQMLDASPFLTALATPDGIMSVTPQAGFSIAFANDTSGVLAALGLNSFFTGTDARTININPLLEEHPEWVSTSGSTDPLNTGDNSIALALASLRSATPLRNGTQTLNDFFESMVVGVGINSRANLDELDVQRAFLLDFQRRRQEVSGVSLDEETTNLLQFQRAFEAAARVITVADRMLETLLNVAR